MLNAEKYRDEILRKAMCNFTKKNCFCPYCDALESVSKKAIYEAAIEWLLSEYEPPLLENGDGLKPGDWIMVKDKNNKWRKRAFIFFKDGIFYTVDMGHEISNSGRYSSWKEVRLPEKGE